MRRLALAAARPRSAAPDSWSCLTTCRRASQRSPVFDGASASAVVAERLRRPASGSGLTSAAAAAAGLAAAVGLSQGHFAKSSASCAVPERGSTLGDGEAVANSVPPAVKKACVSAAHAPPPPETAPATEEEVEERLAAVSVLLFMKGSPDRPRCRFSRFAVEQLRSHGVAFGHCDVLEEPGMRVALRERWPTFPQLWVEGTLLGGADAIRALATRGELLDAIRSSTARERAALALHLQVPKDLPPAPALSAEAAAEAGA
eukprot:TRINITY_DN28478_c0_g1_i1.p1 TRINITY_DN28478_c0_g1~~TRINITY_DN28478_c0_g1_i1.p1  ORF type:complete len:289 (-),score=68.27 TRINITY_DN28478_c0_g1_i1:21-800(-)